MSVDVAGLVLGGISVGALFSAVADCIHGYDRFVSSARNIPGQSRMFATDIRIEERKFYLYWRYMRLSDTACPLLQEQPVRTQELIRDVTMEVLSLLTDAKRLRDDYGFEKVIEQIPGVFELQDMSPSRSDAAISSTVFRGLSELRRDAFLSKDLSSPALTTSQKFSWAWKGQEKASELLQKLQHYNHELWTSLAPHHETLLSQGQPSFILPSMNDLWALQALAQKPAANSASEILAACSDLRKDVVNEEDRSRYQFQITPFTEVQDLKNDTNIRRDVGQFRGDSVIVEYKYIDPTLSHKNQEIIRNRLKSLMRLLSRDHHSTFRILQGVGLLQASPNSLCYGLILKAPRPAPGDAVTFHTLESLLRIRDMYSLGQRFQLALALATAVMHLHAAGWFHKRICPESILFQQVGSSLADITEPRIAGFDLSRPSNIQEVSLETGRSEQVDYFEHPDRQVATPPRFQARHDYFSLGMCLFHVGLWRSTEKVQEAFNSTAGASATAHDWAGLVRKEVPRLLRPRCGDLYSDAVLTCLSGQFPSCAWSSPDGHEWNGQMAFFTEVVQKLAECKA